MSLWKSLIILTLKYIHQVQAKTVILTAVLATSVVGAQELAPLPRGLFT